MSVRGFLAGALLTVGVLTAVWFVFPPRMEVVGDICAGADRVSVESAVTHDLLPLARVQVGGEQLVLDGLKPCDAGSQEATFARGTPFKWIEPLRGEQDLLSARTTVPVHARVEIRFLWVFTERYFVVSLPGGRLAAFEEEG